MQSTTCKSQSISLGGCGVIALMFRVLNEWSVGAVVEVASTSWTQLTQKVHSLSGSNYSLTSFTQGTIDGAYNKWLRAFPCYSPKTLTKIFENLFLFQRHPAYKFRQCWGHAFWGLQVRGDRHHQQHCNRTIPQGSNWISMQKIPNCYFILANFIYLFTFCHVSSVFKKISIMPKMYFVF